MVFGLLRITDGDISSPLSGADNGWLLPFRSEPAGGAVAMSLSRSLLSPFLGVGCTMGGEAQEN